MVGSPLSSHRWRHAGSWSSHCLYALSAACATCAATWRAEGAAWMECACERTCACNYRLPCPCPSRDRRERGRPAWAAAPPPRARPPGPAASSAARASSLVHPQMSTRRSSSDKSGPPPASASPSGGASIAAPLSRVGVFFSRATKNIIYLWT
eukprot:scaffold296859_cov33-Tisochrysis_lutea.AAC.7